MNTSEAIQAFFVRAGAAWVLWLLFALSVASLAVAFERLLAFRKKTVNVQAIAERIDARLAVADISGAIQELAESQAVGAIVARAGLRLAHLGPVAADRAMQSALALERARLEKGLAYLGTVGNNAPFVGLFGTVIGIIQAFAELGHGAPGHAAAGGSASQVASQVVMGSIAEALVATAVGIAVALPAVALYNYLQTRVASILGGVDALSQLVLAYLSAEVRLEPPRARVSAAGDAG